MSGSDRFASGSSSGSTSGSIQTGVKSYTFTPNQVFNRSDKSTDTNMSYLLPPRTTTNGEGGMGTVYGGQGNPAFGERGNRFGT